MTTTAPSDRARPDAAADTLAASMHGDLVRPGDPSYPELRRVWNGSIDRNPTLIARCAGVADVAAAMRFARTQELLVAVRGGGHSFPGYSVCDGGMVVDLGPMRGVRVDAQARTVRVQAGALLGDLDRETQRFGLAVPAGIVTHTGVAGLTLGGGMGWLQRKYGLSIDQLLSINVITADGEFVTAGAIDNADLFWGMRGGGGNFGIATEFEFRLNPVGPAVLAGPIFWPIARAPELLRFYRDWIAHAPDELMTIVVFRKAPALPSIPVELRGELVAGVVACYAGSIAEGERVLRPLRAFDRPVLDLCEPKPFVEHQSMFDPSFPHGWWYYVRACDIAGLSDEVIDITVEYAGRIRSAITSIALWQMGGAVARVGEDETAFNGRSAGHTFNINGNSESASGCEQEREWARAFWSALAPHHAGVYVNFLMDEGDERIREAYGVNKLARLTALKNKYDPDNVFRLNQNIRPDKRRSAELAAGGL